MAEPLFPWTSSSIACHTIGIWEGTVNHQLQLEWRVWTTHLASQFLWLPPEGLASIGVVNGHWLIWGRMKTLAGAQRRWDTVGRHLCLRYLGLYYQRVIPLTEALCWYKNAGIPKRAAHEALSFICTVRFSFVLLFSVMVFFTCIKCHMLRCIHFIEL